MTFGPSPRQSALLIFCFVFSNTILNNSMAAAPYAGKCIGKNDNPNQDAYAKQLDGYIQFVNEAPGQIAALEERNAAIDVKVRSIQELLIPEMDKNFQTWSAIHADYLRYIKDQAEIAFAKRKSDLERKKNSDNEALEGARLIWQADKIQIKKELSLQLIDLEEKFSREKIKRENEFRGKKSNIKATYEDLIKKTNKAYENIFDKIRPIKSYNEQDMAEAEKIRDSAVLSLRAQRNLELADLGQAYENGLSELKTDYDHNVKLVLAKLDSLEMTEKQLGTHIDGLKAANQKNYKLGLEESRKFQSSRISRLQRSLGDVNGNFNRKKEIQLQMIKKLEIEKNENLQKLNGNPNGKPATEGLKPKLARLSFIEEWQNDLKNNKDKHDKLYDMKVTEADVCVNCDLDTDGTSFYIFPNSNPPLMANRCVNASIANKKANTDEIFCENENSQAAIKPNMCVTQQMADYTQWSLNKALKCLSPVNDPYDPQILYEKLNNESTFRFFHAYTGGQGLMQTVPIAQQEILGMSLDKNSGKYFRSTGRKMMAEVMSKKSKACSSYENLFDFKNEQAYDQLAADKSKQAELNALKAKYPEYDNPLFKTGKYCQFLSLDQGLQRNILSGMGLYVYFRKLADEDLRETLGAGHPIFNSNKYKKIRDLTALVYYGREGPAGISTRIRNNREGLKKLLSGDTNTVIDNYDNFLKRISDYAKEIQKSEKSVSEALSEKRLQCTTN